MFMASNRINTEIAEMFLAVQVHHTKGQTDGQLLARFLNAQDEAAFAALVRRHGPMVLGVCGRILGNAADVEDAFQAAFLVLVRKASSLTSRAVLGDWLHGVARRTAFHARRVAARRRVKEKAMARTEAQGEAVRDDWLPLLDEELSRLPEKYRLPIVLCDLEGWTRGEAAARLGWPEGTVAGRLARGRALLARQLVRRGVAMSAGALAAVASRNAAPACVPAPLASYTIRAAILTAAGQAATAGVISAQVTALVEGVLKTMLLTKLKVATAVLFMTAVLCAGLAVGIFVYQAQAGEPVSTQQSSAPPNVKEVPERPDQKDQARPIPGRAEAAPLPPNQPDRIQAGDLLSIQATGTPPDAPIQGIFQVEASGKVALGSFYGRVGIKGLTLEEAEAVIQQHLGAILKKTVVSVTRSVPVPGTKGADQDLERRVRQLEKEVRELRAVVEELRKKPRD
jgi:RNA polymerase sigma factor (sigma-70 family)